MLGFRKVHGCLSVLLKLIGMCKTALDRRKKVRFVIDLSKALDCLPHHLMLAKQNAHL